nr:glycosyltransferase [Clostridia bacterium]
MQILTNCLQGHDDEGGIKVARKIVQEIRRCSPETKLYTYGGEAAAGDGHLQLNKMMLNLKLARLLRGSKEHLLYAPQYARMLPMALRTLVLSIYARGQVNVLLPMCFAPGKAARWMLKLSRARLFVLSHDSWEMMRAATENEVCYVKAGVDMNRFHPVDQARKRQLREKYGFKPEQKIVLHVGHLTFGRNVRTMLSLSGEYQAVLVASTRTRDVWDAELSQRMQSGSTAIRLIDSYLPNIEEIYQAADVYFFPVEEAGRCIDSPISVLEAAACDLPIVTTPYGEVKQLLGREGIHAVNSLDKETVDSAIRKALETKTGARNAVCGYDWQTAAAGIMELIDGEK